LLLLPKKEKVKLLFHFLIHLPVAAAAAAAWLVSVERRMAAAAATTVALRAHYL
jgi:hypothetical protein